MENDDYVHFYEALSDPEKEYWHRFNELFQQVHPQRPEKGIKALLLRARAQAETECIPLEEALKRGFDAATQRTIRRVELLKQCRLSNQ